MRKTIKLKNLPVKNPAHDPRAVKQCVTLASIALIVMKTGIL